MGFCTECGFRLPDDALFCPACGSPVRDYAEPCGGESKTDGDERAYAYAGYPPEPDKRRQSGGKAAAVIIAIVVVLFVAAGYLLEKSINADRTEGYWESAAVEVNGEERDTYFGKDINGLFGLQLDVGGTAQMCSAFNKDVFKGKWRKNGNTITITGSGEKYLLTKKRGKLYLYNNGLYIKYEKRDGDVDHPSVAHGSLAEGNGGGTEALPSPAPAEGAAGYLDGKSFYVQVTGAESFRNADGNDELRVYFTFKNCTENSFSAADALNFEASQDGDDLDIDKPADGPAAGELLYATIRPGITVQCCCCFDYDPDGGDISFSICGWFGSCSDAPVSTDFKSQSLPGAPKELAITPVPEPKWTTALPAEGTLGDDKVAVTGAELTTDENGEAAVRVHYRFTNGGKTEVCVDDAVFANTYQDGVSLETAAAAQETDSDRLFEEPVKPGQTIEATRVYKLRNSSSQIEAEMESTENYDAVGQTYSVKG